MGDSGSMLLGFTLAALAVARQRQASNVFAIMGVPILFSSCLSWTQHW